MAKIHEYVKIFWIFSDFLLTNSHKRYIIYTVSEG